MADLPTHAHRRPAGQPPFATYTAPAGTITAVDPANFRMTDAARQVLHALADATDETDRYGGAIAVKIGATPGTVGPLLIRLQRHGLATSRWETPGTGPGRPARRYYQLTDAGRALATEHAAETPA